MIRHIAVPATDPTSTSAAEKARSFTSLSRSVVDEAVSVIVRSTHSWRCGAPPHVASKPKESIRSNVVPSPTGPLRGAREPVGARNCRSRPWRCGSYAVTYGPLEVGRRRCLAERGRARPAPGAAANRTPDDVTWTAGSYSIVRHVPFSAIKMSLAPRLTRTSPASHNVCAVAGPTVPRSQGTSRSSMSS